MGRRGLIPTHKLKDKYGNTLFHMEVYPFREEMYRLFDCRLPGEDLIVGTLEEIATYAAQAGVTVFPFNQKVYDEFLAVTRARA